MLTSCVRNASATTAPGLLTLTGQILKAECLGIGGDLHEGVWAWLGGQRGPWSLRRVTHHPGWPRMSVWPSGAATGAFLGKLGRFRHPTLQSRLPAAFPKHFGDFGNVIQALGLFPQL